MIEDIYADEYVELTLLSDEEFELAINNMTDGL